MKKISFISYVVMAIISFSLTSTVHADDSVVNVIQEGDAYKLEVPSSVPDSDVILENDTQNIYKIDEVAVLTNEKGESYTGSGIVENNIIEETDEGVLGVTTYQIDLSDIDEKIDGNNDSFISTFSSIFSTKVYADSNNTSSNEIWDPTISVKLRMTVRWIKYDSGHINITGVSGGYSRSDASVYVTGSQVFVGQGMSTAQQTRTYYPGTSSYWNYSTGFTKVGNQGWITHKYVKYTANLKRNSSTWTVVLDNVL